MAHFHTSTEDDLYEPINPTVNEKNIHRDIMHTKTPSASTEKCNSPTPPEYSEISSKLCTVMDLQADDSNSVTHRLNYISTKGTPAHTRSSSEKPHSTRPRKPPPPIYPKTKRLSYSSSKPSAISMHQQQMAFSSSIEIRGMQLSEFVAANLQSLPQRVEVVQGVYGLDDKSTLSACDVLNIHQVIERDVAKVEDTKSHQAFFFPLNTVVKFSPVYYSDDHSIRDDAHFSVAELLSLKPLPRVVCVLKGCNSTHLSLKFETNEILVVNGVVKSDTPRNPSTLQVYSIHSKCEKSIVESNVLVQLSVAPEYTQMSLSQITEHILSRPLPVMLFSDSVSASKIPENFYSGIFHVKEVVTEVLVVATYTHAQPNLTDGLLSIPIDLDVRVRVIDLGKAEMQDLKFVTASIVSTSTQDHSPAYQNISIGIPTKQAEIYAAVHPHKFQHHRSSKENTTVHEDAGCINSTSDLSHNQNASDQRKEAGVAKDAVSRSGQRFGDDFAMVEPLGFLDEQIQREISSRVKCIPRRHSDHTTKSSNASPGNINPYAEREPIDINKEVIY